MVINICPDTEFSRREEEREAGREMTHHFVSSLCPEGDVM